jgi:DNA-binding MarR family transcriptional regulator
MFGVALSADAAGADDEAGCWAARLPHEIIAIVPATRLAVFHGNRGARMARSFRAVGVFGGRRRPAGGDCSGCGTGFTTGFDEVAPGAVGRYTSYMNRKAAAPAGLFALLHTANAVQAQVESRLDAIGLSLAKLAALRALADAGESLPLGQLAGRLACVKSNITQLVDRLESDGLVARQPDPHDRRGRLAVLTAAGKKACRDGTRIQQEAEASVFGALTADEASALGALMQKLAPQA